MIYLNAGRSVLSILKIVIAETTQRGAVPNVIGSPGVLVGVLSFQRFSLESRPVAPLLGRGSFYFAASVGGLFI